jgi:hypothetical protein
MKTQQRVLRRLTITVPEELHEELSEAAFVDMTSVAAIVRRAVDIHLRRRREALSR